MSKQRPSAFLTGVAIAAAISITHPGATPLHAKESQATPNATIAAVSGDYEFDLTEAGAGVLVLKFLVKDAALWVQTAASSGPDRLEPVVGRDSTFAMTDPEEGTYVVEFLDGGAGRSTKARLTNQTLGIDVIGIRLASPVHFPTLSERLQDREGFAETREDLQGTRVAVYFGRGMDPHSALALGRAFQWMGCDVEVVDAAAIRQGALDRFDLVAFPGGERDPDPWGELGREGKSAIQGFVRGGGGYVGVCLGALFAARTADFWGDRLGVDELYLDLFPGVAHCGQRAVAPKGSWPLMTDLVTTPEGRAISNAIPPKMVAVTYPNGPYFEPDSTADVTVVSTFAATGEPAMVALEYGRGRVFLSGPHPEIDVDSDRDGSNRFDELDDQGSEWPVLLAVARWLTAR
jgi:glutamine amidotransferase-like uncharacterized protein